MAAGFVATAFFLGAAALAGFAAAALVAAGFFAVFFSAFFGLGASSPDSTAAFFAAAGLAFYDGKRQNAGGQGRVSQHQPPWWRWPWSWGQA